MEWFNPGVPRTVSISLNEAKKVARPKVGLLVATENELRQVLRLMRPLPKRRQLFRVDHGHETTYIGKFGSHQAVLVLCSMGTQGATGATLTANSVITTWKLAAAVFVGIAFGAHREKQSPADVLVASQLIPYESQRRGKQTVYRNPVPPTGGRLLNRFRNALDWEFQRPDGSRCKMFCGPVLSGEKLVDSPKFKQELLTRIRMPLVARWRARGCGLLRIAHKSNGFW